MVRNTTGTCHTQVPHAPPLNVDCREINSPQSGLSDRHVKQWRLNAGLDFLQVQALEPPIMQEVLLDLPGLLFFSTYTLLVLFWAEIYHQARSLSTTALRPMFVAFNGVVYAVQVFALHAQRIKSTLWWLQWLKQRNVKQVPGVGQQNDVRP